MNEPPHVDQRRIDDAYVTAFMAMQQPVNEGRIVRAMETMEEALAEMRYFGEPANAANIRGVAALRYAWRTERVFREGSLIMAVMCVTIATIMLMGQPWRTGVPHVMEMMGFIGLLPTLFGAIWLQSGRSASGMVLAYQVRAAPLLLTAGLGFVALGLLGHWLI